MPITIISTPGAVDANSYLSLAEANEYLLPHTDASFWDALDDEQKKAAIVTATRTLDLLIYNGRKATQAQSLAWPRTGIIDRDGYAVYGVPKLLKDAVCEQLMYTLTEDENLASDFELENLDSVEVGPLKYKMKAGLKVGLPSEVQSRIDAIAPELVVEGEGSSKSAKVMVL